MKKNFLGFLILVYTFFGFIINVYAASVGISASTTSVVTGGSVTITVKATGLIGKFSITSSNGNILSGGTNSVWLENETKTYKFNAKNIGSATITVKAIDVSDTSGISYSDSKSVTINVVKPREKSNNNNLKSLSVEGYKLSPGFNKNTLEYTVNLESNVEKIKINATKEDGYASVSGTGEKEVQEGDNKFEIKVTSETGKSKVYTVNAIVKDSNPIVKIIDGKNYTIVKRASALNKPDGFDETTVSISETEIPAFYNEKTQITLIGLKDDQGIINLFQYDSNTDKYIKYESIASTSKTIILNSTDEEIDRFTKTKVMIEDNEYNAYQYPKNKDYILVYGIDLETGNKNWYLYNLKERSIQTYMGDIIIDMEDNFSKTLQEYKIVILVLSGLTLLLLLIMIILIISKNKMKNRIIKKFQQEKENNSLKTDEESIEEVKEETKEPKQVNSCKKEKKNK